MLFPFLSAPLLLPPPCTMKYSPPPPICHHSFSLFFQTYLHPLLAIGSHSRVPALPSHSTGTPAQTATTYARSLKLHCGLMAEMFPQEMRDLSQAKQRPMS